MSHSDPSHLASGELVERGLCDSAEVVEVNVVECDRNDLAARNETCIRQVEQARQELAPREIARGTEQDDDLREFGTYPCGDFGHRANPFWLSTLGRETRKPIRFFDSIT